MTTNDTLETIGGHVDVVREHCGDTWPDDPPDDDCDALASWCYVNGWANALNRTANELIDELGL